MNHIQSLTMQRDAAREALQNAQAELNDLLVYLESSKFRGDGDDYIYITTDLKPKLMALRMTMLES
jgi:hypothetical protein